MSSLITFYIKHSAEIVLANHEVNVSSKSQLELTQTNVGKMCADLLVRSVLGLVFAVEDAMTGLI